ncbi:MAG: hypothetical protein ABEJ36_00675 [Candidatus Nanosalina sp.]
MDEEDLDSIVERDGRVFLESSSGGKLVPLMQVFESYEVRNLDVRDTAEFLGLEEREVRQGVHYFHSDSDVYSRLEERVEDFSRRDHISGAAEKAWSEEPYVERQKNDELMNSLHGAENGFIEIFERTDLSEDHLEDFPDEKVLTDSATEVHLYWEQEGFELGIYAGFTEEKNLDSGLISYSVDGEHGPVLEIEIGEMEDKVQEMYRNAMFGAL